MNKDDDYFDQNDKYPKVGLLNEDIVKDDFANASKKTAGNKLQQIELSEYQPLADDYDQNGTKPIFNPRGNPNAIFEEKKNDNPFQQNNKPKPASQNPLPPPPPPRPPQQQPPLPNPQVMSQPPMYIINPQTLFYQPPTFPGTFNPYVPQVQPMQQPIQPINYLMPVTCPRCSLYQAVPANSNGFICPRCNNVITVFNLASQSKILVCDKCKSNVIFQIGSSPLIECSNCKTINYAQINDPQNLYGPKK